MPMKYAEAIRLRCRTFSDGNLFSLTIATHAKENWLGLIPLQVFLMVPRESEGLKYIRCHFAKKKTDC